MEEVMQDEELIAALLKVEGNRPDSLGISTQWYRNPEGPQAVEALTTAQAEIEALRARVAEFHEHLTNLCAEDYAGVGHEAFLAAMQFLSEYNRAALTERKP